jgi:hypothetical protein
MIKQSKALVTRFLISVLITMSCLFTVQEARAQLAALGFLVEPALNVAARMIVQSVGRVALVSVGVAANDASWLVPLVTLTSRAASILRIAGAINAYELPLQPGVVVPPAPVPDLHGEIGTFDNPLPYDSELVAMKPTNARLTECVEVDMSNDGYAHKLPLIVYASFADLSSACEGIRAQFARPGVYKAPLRLASMSDYNPYGGSPVAPYGLPGSPYYVEASMYCTGHMAAVYDPYKGADFCYQTAVAVDLSTSEPADGVKRFVRTNEGFKPDPADPDWTAEERVQYGAAQSVQFKAADKSVVVNVAATGSSTEIKAAAQRANDVVLRTVKLTSEAVPESVTETAVKDANADQVIASSTSNNGDPGTIVFPTDYARQGEAAAAANPLGVKLDTLHADLTQKVDGPADPTLPPTSDFEDGFFKGTFSKLLAWNLPPHTSTCPTTTMNLDFFGRPLTLKMDEQCQLLNDPAVATVAAVSFDVSWLIAALFIVLWA